MSCHGAFTNDIERINDILIPPSTNTLSVGISIFNAFQIPPLPLWLAYYVNEALSNKNGVTCKNETLSQVRIIYAFLNQL